MKKKAIKKTATAVAAILIFGIIIALVYPSVSVQHNPEKLIKKYISAVYENDLEAIYKYTTIKESPFSDKEDFRSKGSISRFTEADLIDFDIEKIKEENNIHTFGINYLAEDNSTGTFYLTAKMTENGFWKYDKYLIVPSINNTGNITVYAAENTTVFISGNKLKPVDEQKTDEISGRTFGVKKFTAENLFPGKYKITAENELCKDFSTEIIIDNIESNYEIYIEQSITDDFLTVLSDKAKQAAGEIFGAVINSKTDELKPLFTGDFIEKRFDNYIKETSENFYKNNDSYNISGIEILSAPPQTDSDSIVISGKRECRIDIPLKFDYSYTAENPNFNKQEYKQVKSDTGLLYIQYIFENGEWKINNISQQVWF